MKKDLRLKCSSISIVPLLISMLAVIDTGVNKSNIAEYIGDDCYSVSSYIEDNFSLFVEKYNEVSNEPLNATYVEKSFGIDIVDHEGRKNGVFLDFDADNGYAVVGDGYTFYDFSQNADSPYENIESEKYCYSTVSGYLYLKDQEFVDVDESKNMPEDCLDDISFGSKPNNGQTEYGCGHIDELNSYVKDRYGSDWAISKSESLSMATGKYTTQMMLSCYHDYTYGDGDDILYWYGEANCWFVSAYNVLQSLADSTDTYKDKVDSYKTDKSKASMPRGSTLEDYDAKTNEPSLYSKIYDASGKNISGTITSKSGFTNYKKALVNSSFPALYNQVRRYVVNKYNKVDDGSVYDTASIINEIGKQYGYNFKAKGTVAAGLYSSSGMTAINRGLPFVLCTSSLSNAGYGDHLMAGCGYKVYSKTSGWWIFKTTSYKYFYELRDGHNEGVVYFDLSAWSGLGGMVMLDYSLFSY